MQNLENRSYFFSKILHEVRHQQSKKSDTAGFLKKILTRLQAPILVYFGHKNEVFSKYLKNASLNFFYIWHDFRTD